MRDICKKIILQDEHGNTVLHEALLNGDFDLAYDISKKILHMEVPSGSISPNNAGQSLLDCLQIGKVKSSGKFVLHVTIMGCLTEDDDRKPFVVTALGSCECTQETGGSHNSPEFSFEYKQERYYFLMPVFFKLGCYCFDDVEVVSSKIRELEEYIHRLCGH